MQRRIRAIAAAALLSFALSGGTALAASQRPESPVAAFFSRLVSRLVKEKRSLPAPSANSKLSPPIGVSDPPPATP